MALKSFGDDKMNSVERLFAKVLSAVGVGVKAAIAEGVKAPSFRFNFQCIGPRDEDRERYVSLRDRIDAMVKGFQKSTDEVLARLRAELAAIPLEERWVDGFSNVVTTGGKNDLLDKYFAGSSYTAAWYLGLICAVSYGAGPVAGDTMASHAGWLEGGATNLPTYSQSSRPTLAFSSASSGSKATSSALAYSMTGTGTVKGAFTTTVATKDGTTGILYSAGLFTGGDRAVLNGDTLNVSLTLSV
jgi:hypothetical protein